jgi:hypothetical protein
MGEGGAGARTFCGVLRSVEDMMRGRSEKKKKGALKDVCK